VPTIATDQLSAEIDPFGAQLVSLRHHRVGEMLWQGDKAIWPDHAPILFPTVGRVRDDLLIIDGKAWPMLTHGVAKRSDFTIVQHEADRMALTLDGHEGFPFAFRLTLEYRLVAETLSVTLIVENHEVDRRMPVNFGFHPGFSWPLPGAPNKSGHVISFSEDEDTEIRRLMSERLLAPHHGERFLGRELSLAEDLFLPSALMLSGLRSREVVYSGPTDTKISVAFPDSTVLALWMRGGGEFVCIEPWHALPQTADFSGDYASQPGIALVPAGGSVTSRLLISVSG
jgi:galactose mutarotase-like enzyme